MEKVISFSVLWELSGIIGVWRKREELEPVITAAATLIVF